MDRRKAYGYAAGALMSFAAGILIGGILASWVTKRECMKLVKKTGYV